jgi:hypothetical protein
MSSSSSSLMAQAGDLREVEATLIGLHTSLASAGTPAPPRWVARRSDAGCCKQQRKCQAPSGLKRAEKVKLGSPALAHLNPGGPGAPDTKGACSDRLDACSERLVMVLVRAGGDGSLDKSLCGNRRALQQQPCTIWRPFGDLQPRERRAKAGSTLPSLAHLSLQARECVQNSRLRIQCVK